MPFKKFSRGRNVSGPGRLAVLAEVQTPVSPSGDPANMAAIMNGTFDFVSPWIDPGATQGGINITIGHDIQGYQHDLSESDFDEEITATTATVETQFADVGRIDLFEQAWLSDSTTAVVGGTLEQIKGLPAGRTIGYRSVVVLEADRTGKLRAFFVREMSRAAGDSQLSLNKGALHTLPVSYVGHANSAAASGREFGFIMQQANFGGS